MSTISQRELRNESGRVLREVEAGHEFVVTRRGVPTARIVPLGATDEPDSAGALPRRPARRPAVFPLEELVSSPVSTAQILEDLRAER